MVRKNPEADKLDLSPNVVVTGSEAPDSEVPDSDPVLADPSLAATPQSLKSYYSKAEVIAIETANCLEQALDEYESSVLKRHLPGLVLVVLRSVCSVSDEKILQLFTRLMHSPSVPELLPNQALPHIVLLAPDLSPLRQIICAINAYEGGFVALCHPCQLAEVVAHVPLARAGLVHFPEEMTHGFDRTWLEVLKLKFEEGLSDGAIARRLGVSDRAICHYWRRIQRALNVSDDPDKDQHIQIEQAAREAELIYNKVVSLKKASFAAKKEGSGGKMTSAKVVS
ncbi:MAG: hypothetical protein KTR27_01580 [Leptolyngbyaceae cyanobacterium MAG.088]|nr:hypothetical protein [Leptolyngbyaceae cyanobacterium MAG.088]